MRSGQQLSAVGILIQQSLVILRSTLFAEILFRELVVVLRYLHALVMLPGLALFAADHLALVFGVFFDLAAHAADDRGLRLFICWRRFVLFGAHSRRRHRHNMVIAAMLALGRPSGASCFCTVNRLGHVGYLAYHSWPRRCALVVFGADRRYNCEGSDLLG